MIRSYASRDYDAVSRVCVLTGEAGGDATGLHPSDDYLPDTWLRPYLRFEPDLAWVVDEGEGARGYLVATADSRRFAQRYRDEWRRGGDQGPLIPEVDEYPAHLHVDLLPELQGRGYGRALIEGLVAELGHRRIRGLHLGVDARNGGAIAFYRRLGFRELESSSPESLMMARSLG